MNLPQLCNTSFHSKLFSNWRYIEFGHSDTSNFLSLRNSVEWLGWSRLTSSHPLAHLGTPPQWSAVAYLQCPPWDRHTYPVLSWLFCWAGHPSRVWQGQACAPQFTTLSVAPGKQIEYKGRSKHTDAKQMTSFICVHFAIIKANLVVNWKAMKSPVHKLNW